MIWLCIQSPSPTEGPVWCGPESELASHGHRACRWTRDTRRGERLPPQRGAARGEGPADPLRSILRWILHAQVPLAHSPPARESAPPRHDGDRRRHDLAPPTRRPTLFTRAGTTAPSTPCSSAAPRTTCATPTPTFSPVSERSLARVDEHTRAHAVRGMRTRLAGPGAVW